MKGVGSMSDGFIAVLGMGFLAGAITTLIIMGVCSNERTDKRKHGNDYHTIIRIPVGDGNRRCDNGRNQRLESEIKEQAKRLNVKIGG